MEFRVTVETMHNLWEYHVVAEDADSAEQEGVALAIQDGLNHRINPFVTVEELS